MRDNMPKQIKRTFEIPLTESEKKEFGKNAADLSFEKVMLEDEFENAKRAWKSKIDAKGNEIYKLLHCLRTGTIDRELEVFVEYNYDTKTVEYVHQGEIVETRPLTVEEHQMFLRLEQKNRDDKAKMNDEVNAKSEADSINEAEEQEATNDNA